MKKKLFSIILAGILIISLVGCSSPKPEDTVDTFLTNAQSLDLEKMSESMNPDSEDSLDKIGNDESDKTTDCLMDYFRENSSKMTYEIKNSEVDGDTAVVTVNFKYIDGTGALKDALSKLFEEAFYQAFSEDEMSDEEMEDLLVKAINDYDPEDGDTFDTKTVEINCIKKDNKWYIDEISDDLLDVIFCNCPSYLDSLDF